jgi:hypothetical protein
MREVVTTVKRIVYASAFLVFRVWNAAARGRSPSRTSRVMANVALAAIAAAFLNGYLARVALIPDVLADEVPHRGLGEVRRHGQAHAAGTFDAFLHGQTALRPFN